jgi:NADH dehydrogenase FAD-containing subunit
VTRHLVLAGAGHAQLDLLAALARARPSGWEITLVTPQPAFHYSGMLPAIIAGVVPPDAASIPVAAIAQRIGLQVRTASIVGMDAATQVLRLSDGGTLRYDLLSLDVGSRPAGMDAPGAGTNAFPMRPFAAALGLVERLDALRVALPSGTTVPAVVVGAGAAGVEIAFAVRARLHAHGLTPQVTIVDGAAGDGLPLAGFADESRRKAAKALAARGIVVTGADVVAVQQETVTVRIGRRESELPALATAWVTGPAAHPWLAESGLDCDTRGYPFADATLALDRHERVFGGGDCITLRRGKAAPKAGVYAVRMAPVLAANVMAVMEGRRERQTFVPQSDFLALLSTSDGRALLRWRSVTVESRWAQWLKDRIDLRYLDAYRALAG